MRTLNPRCLRYASLLVCFGTLIVAAQDRHIFVVGGGIRGSLTNSPTVSHGHACFVSGEPGFLFGGIQDGAGKRDLNYLVLVKHNAVATSSFEYRDPDPTVSNESSDGIVRQFHFKERVRLDKTSFDFSYKARIDIGTDVLHSETMTVAGKTMRLKNGRVFVVDMTVEPVSCQQVNVKLPSCENADFLDGRDEEYQEFTRRWMKELVSESKVLAETFNR
jgi:hypothetical protein